MILCLFYGQVFRNKTFIDDFKLFYQAYILEDLIDCRKFQLKAVVVRIYILKFIVISYQHFLHLYSHSSLSSRSYTRNCRKLYISNNSFYLPSLFIAMDTPSSINFFHNFDHTTLEVWEFIAHILYLYSYCLKNLGHYFIF